MSAPSSCMHQCSKLELVGRQTAATSVYGVVVQELKVSYHNKETYTIYRYYGSLTAAAVLRPPQLEHP